MLKAPTPDPTVDRQEIEEAVQRANLPTLVMVLVQLTGDQKWLEEPYRPTAGRGLTAHDGGGFDQQTAAAIRQAAAEEILRWHHGSPPAIPNPPGDLLLALLSQAVGEAVPPEYGRLMAVEMGFEAPDAPSSVPRRPAAAASTRDPDTPTVVIIGAGISGMAAAVRLQQLNVDHVILERNNDVGGVWLTNTYPGAGVDTPSFLYSFSFYTRKWSTHFAKQAEMIEYLRDTADHFDLRRDIRFNTTVSAARWDDDAHLWRITAHGPEGEVQLEAPFLISAVGLFNKPSVPSIPGLDSFAGALVPHGQVARRPRPGRQAVAVIGTGASAMQVVPAVADRVKQLTIFQRSPQWVAPNGEYFAKVSDGVHFLMEHVPYYHQWYRFRLAWIFNDRVHPSLQMDPEWPDPDHSLNVVNDGHRRNFIRYVDEQLGDRVDLRDKVLPTYPPFGKRMLLDNGWFAALKKHNVQLVTERVESVTPAASTPPTATGTPTPSSSATGFDVRQYLPGPAGLRPRRSVAARVLGPRGRGRPPRHDRARLPQLLHDVRPQHERVAPVGATSSSPSAKSRTSRS